MDRRNKITCLGTREGKGGNLCGCVAFVRLLDTGDINFLHIFVSWKEVRQECTKVRVSRRSNACGRSYGIAENI